jgi:hypothetical protein
MTQQHTERPRSFAERTNSGNTDGAQIAKILPEFS